MYLDIASMKGNGAQSVVDAVTTLVGQEFPPIRAPNAITPTGTRSGEAGIHGQQDASNRAADHRLQLRHRRPTRSPAPRPHTTTPVTKEEGHQHRHASPVVGSTLPSPIEAAASRSKPP